MICITQRLGAWEPERATLEGKGTGGERAAAAARERAGAWVFVREPGGGWGQGPAWLKAALRNLEERLRREAGDREAGTMAERGRRSCARPGRLA